MADGPTDAHAGEQELRDFCEERPDLPYFYLAMARDLRTLIAHEGVHATSSRARGPRLAGSGSQAEIGPLDTAPDSQAL